MGKKEKLCTFLEAIEDDRYQDDESMDESAFSRKHYQIVAGILNNYYEPKTAEIIGAIAHDFADFFAQDNPNFDAEKFLGVVGLKNEETEDDEDEEDLDENEDKECDEGEECDDDEDDIEEGNDEDSDDEDEDEDEKDKEKAEKDDGDDDEDDMEEGKSLPWYVKKRNKTRTQRIKALKKK